MDDFESALEDLESNNTAGQGVVSDITEQNDRLSDLIGELGGTELGVKIAEGTIGWSNDNTYISSDYVESGNVPYLVNFGDGSFNLEDAGKNI